MLQISNCHLPPVPRHEEVDNAPLSLGGDGDSTRNLPPLDEAVATTTGAGVLRLEHMVPTHWRLLPGVIRRIDKGASGNTHGTADNRSRVSS